MRNKAVTEILQYKSVKVKPRISLYSVPVKLDTFSVSPYHFSWTVRFRFCPRLLIQFLTYETCGVSSEQLCFSVLVRQTKEMAQNKEHSSRCFGNISCSSGNGGLRVWNKLRRGICSERAQGKKQLPSSCR